MAFPFDFGTSPGSSSDRTLGTSAQLGAGITSIGGAVSDIFGGLAADKSEASYRAAAAQYRKAAGLATENLATTEQSYGVRQLQTQRQIFQTNGTIQANLAGNGFALSGSGADILADSARQGTLQHQLLQQQEGIDINNLNAQIGSLNLQATQADQAADAAKSSGLLSEISGAIKGVAGIAQLAMFL